MSVVGMTSPREEVVELAAKKEDAAKLLD